jgi:Probable cobalt transporter subunit (CbtA)
VVRTFLVRGMLVGVVAGLLSFAFLKIYGEPQLERAVAFETGQAEARAAARKAEGHMHMSDEDENELVSRSTQAGLGLFVAVLFYSTAFGGLFGLAYALACGRVSSALTPQALSAALAATGFVAIYFVPNLKYPANPPSVGAPETIGIRTALYFLMIAISLAATIASLTMKRSFVARFGEWNANLSVAACYIALVGIAALLLPAVDEVPDQFPAVVLWNFRLASVGAQLIMWATLGLLFGALTQRAAALGEAQA